MEVILLPKRSSGPHGVRLGVDEIALSWCGGFGVLLWCVVVLVCQRNAKFCWWQFTSAVGAGCCQEGNHVTGVINRSHGALLAQIGRVPAWARHFCAPPHSVVEGLCELQTIDLKNPKVYFLWNLSII